MNKKRNPTPYNTMTSYEAAKYKEFNEACFNVSKGVKTCHWMDWNKGELQSGPHDKIKLYVVPKDERDDEVFIYKYDFVKELIGFILTLDKDNDLRHTIQGLLFGYGLREIDDFMKQIKKLKSHKYSDITAMKESSLAELEKIETSKKLMEDEKHIAADKVLMDILNKLGFDEVVKKYDDIPKYYV